MAKRIQVFSKVPDPREASLARRFEEIVGIVPERIRVADAYTIDARVSTQQLEAIGQMLSNPVSQGVEFKGNSIDELADFVLEIGFLPGVTDNIGASAKSIIQKKVGVIDAGVYASRLIYITGGVSYTQVKAFGEGIANKLIERINVTPPVPRVRISNNRGADIVDLMGASDEELVAIGKSGIKNADGSRRGPLAMSLEYMKALQRHYQKKGRDPFDVEVELTGQSWSEHCEHTLFADPIDEFQDGLFKSLIRGATSKIRALKGDKDICVSVFTDNSGAIRFGDGYLITDKAETHNSPSALDPFGGAITGIVGVNRDAIGFGLGAKPILNAYGFCVGNLNQIRRLFRDNKREREMLSQDRIFEGVIAGVHSGGNCSGIPTPQGFIKVDPGCAAKPSIFVRTLGLIPEQVNGQASYEKQARPGDYIVMIGGRVGLDGIHGATFSSEALDAGSPATAVQIGDPITQKKLSDMIVKEARDRGLYTSITDNGAGGLACSVGEMAEESGGAILYVDRVPLKYPGLSPWEIIISESQERMTAAVPKEKADELLDLCRRRDVEATIIGEFTDSGSFVAQSDGQCVLDLDLEFLHRGRPRKHLKTTFTQQIHEEPPRLESIDDLTQSLHGLLGRHNIASTAFISTQYDHEVQGGSVLKPLQGKGQVNADATVTRPLLDNLRGVVISQGINPSYSEIDTYHMAAAAIDTAVRNAVCAGADPTTIHLMDNFCWCSSNEPERLGQLKRAVQACYDTAVAYLAPFISGKDSMFNDFRGFDEEGNPVNISIPPTLLASSVGLIEDSRKAVSIDAKVPGDLVYVIGTTKEELGGSEYFAMIGEQSRGKAYIGNQVPIVDTQSNNAAYHSLAGAIKDELIASATSVHIGGLAVALAKCAMAGKLGMELSLEHLASSASHDDASLFSESQGRVVVTIDPNNKESFEKAMEGTSISLIGNVRIDNKFYIADTSGKPLIETTIDKMLESYRSTFEGY